MKILLFLLTLPSAALASANTPAAPSNEEPVKKLLVISPKAFEKTLQEFVTWKKTLLSVEWVALEDILQKSQGADDPEKLKRWLYAEWREHGAAFCTAAAI